MFSIEDLRDIQDLPESFVLPNYLISAYSGNTFLTCVVATPLITSPTIQEGTM